MKSSTSTSTNESLSSAPPASNPSGWSTTVKYLIGAGISLAVTGIIVWMNQPAEITEYGKVGEEFFADFVDPAKATGLEVLAFDTDKVQPVSFAVKRNENDQWIVPSHHGYPADAEERLAQTATSLIGVQRGAMVTRWASDHARFGVVNPKQDALDVDEVDGVGKRLTLVADDDSVLADFIVGDQVDGSANDYYVRHPDEDEVYITTLDLDLSTKFTDWIDRQLFDVDSGDFRRLVVNDYSFDELTGSLSQTEAIELSREDLRGDWTGDAWDSEKEEPNNDSIDNTLVTITDLEIIGVRPKQEGLTPDLKLDRSAITSQNAVDRIQDDLLSRGFLLQPGENGDPNQLRLIAREGELSAGTDEGLVYRLYFGRAFAGSQEEMEIGFSAGGDDSPEKSSGEESATESPDDSDDSSSSPDADPPAAGSEKPGRYVFVQVSFDPTLLGEKLTRPTAPTKSEKLLKFEKDLVDGEKGDSEATDDAAEEEPKDETTGSEADKEAAAQDGEASESEELTQSDTDVEIQQLRDAFLAAQSDYENDLANFEDYERHLKEGQTSAKKLNRRFANWYYVISGKSYEELSLDRSSLIQEKEKPADSEIETGAAPNLDSVPSAPTADIAPQDTETQTTDPVTENNEVEKENTEKTENDAPSDDDSAEPSGDDSEDSSTADDDTDAAGDPAAQETNDPEPADGDDSTDP